MSPARESAPSIVRRCAAGRSASGRFDHHRTEDGQVLPNHRGVVKRMAVPDGILAAGRPNRFLQGIEQVPGLPERIVNAADSGLQREWAEDARTDHS